MKHAGSDCRWPLGVFASVDAGFGVRLEVARELAVPTMHLHAPRQTPRTQETADAFRQRVEGLGIQVTVVFAGFPGESYADIPATKASVGLAPPATRDQRLEELKRIIDFTSMLGVRATGLHIGFVPHDPASPGFESLVGATQSACRHAQRRNINLHLETGQEPVGVLLEFLRAVGEPNLFVNFDPANMILYGCGEPIPALEQLAGLVRSVHCKDARWSDRPGQTWGQETPLGQGGVDFAELLQTLDQIGYDGPLTIEREISQQPEQQQAEIGAAVKLLNRLKAPYRKQE